MLLCQIPLDLAALPIDEALDLGQRRLELRMSDVTDYRRAVFPAGPATRPSPVRRVQPMPSRYSSNGIR